MAKPTKKNQRKRGNGMRDRLVRDARKLAGADPDSVSYRDDLRKHFEARDAYVSRDKNIHDYVELTPLTLSRLADYPESKLPETAAEKGRRIERERRQGKRAASDRWNGGKQAREKSLARQG